jgi:hypothetical protein
LSNAAASLPSAGPFLFPEKDIDPMGREALSSSFWRKMRRIGTENNDRSLAFIIVEYFSW